MGGAPGAGPSIRAVAQIWGRFCTAGRDLGLAGRVGRQGQAPLHQAQGCRVALGGDQVPVGLFAGFANLGGHQIKGLGDLAIPGALHQQLESGRSWQQLGSAPHRPQGWQGIGRSLNRATGTLNQIACRPMPGRGFSRSSRLLGRVMINRGLPAKPADRQHRRNQGAHPPGTPVAPTAGPRSGLWWQRSGGRSGGSAVAG